MYVEAMIDQWMTHRLDIDGDPGTLLDREWLLTNGTGAYAMGTVGAINTRRYHGLLVASTAPPVGRTVALNQVLEKLFMGNGDQRAFEFTSCAFDDDSHQSIAPQGYRMLDRFEKGLSVRWTYLVEGIQLSRELFVHWQRQEASLRYVVSGLTGPGRLHLYPMLTLRDFHSILKRDQSGGFSATANGSEVRVCHDDAVVTLSCPRSRFVAEPQWWYDFSYAIDAERGQENREDAYLPGRFEVLLPEAEQHEVWLTVALGDHAASPCTHQDRATMLTPIAERLGGQKGRLFAIATTDFLVQRRLGGQWLSTILAGYPWFADWGRDTFIALPGLLLTTGRFDEAHTTLKAFASAIRDGLIPNRFDDYDDQMVHYNTVDASLWFIHAAIAFVKASGRTACWEDWLGGTVRSIIDAYMRGTDYDIAMGGDGLISAGSSQTQLTWMDAACDGVVFTPRFGRAVEINALWYNALVGCTEMLADRDDRTADHYRRLSSRTRRAFNRIFWDDARGCLYDCMWVDPDGREHRDTSIRPNQIFAVSLPHSPLPRTRQKRMLATVRDQLLTPYGLRSLSPDDSNYHGEYRGTAFQREEAYHQGTVWPWLIGPYVEAVLRAGEFKPPAIKRARADLKPLVELISGPGLGQLHEIHEAGAPHRPRGCMAQAWSIAEVLRVMKLIEDCGE